MYGYIHNVIQSSFLVITAVQYFKKTRKLLWNAGAAVFFTYVGFQCVFAALELSGVDFPEICKNTEVVSVPSPDGNKVARIGYSDCGAFTRVQTGVLLVDLKSGEEYGGIFGIDSEPGDLRVSWESDKLLVFSNFPMEKLLWFNQKPFSGVKFRIQ